MKQQLIADQTWNFFCKQKIKEKNYIYFKTANTGIVAA
jgi:hypothetical protein